MFGNLFARKRRFLAQINGAQKALSNEPSHFHVQLEQVLLKEYSKIRRQEEKYWALKSRLNWAAYGDQNTSIFHVSTLVRRHRNKIKSIKNSIGEWITKEDEVKNFILAGYREIYETNHSFSSRDLEIENHSCCFLSNEETDFSIILSLRRR